MLFVVLIVAAGAFYYSLISYLKSQDKGWLCGTICCGFTVAVLTFFVMGFLNMIIAVLVGGMFACLKYERKSHSRWCRPAATVFGGAGILLAVVNLSLNTDQTHEDVVLPENNRIIKIKAGGLGMGKFLLRADYTNVIVLTNSGMDPDLVEQFVSSLKSGLGASSIAVTTEVIPSQDPDSLPADVSYDRLLTSQITSAINSRHSDCPLVISMIRLPIKIFEHYAGKLKDEDDIIYPQFALFNVSVERLQELIKAKYIVCAIQGNPQPKVFKAGMQPSEDLNLIFDENFIIISKRNLSDMKSKYPMIF